MKKRPARPQIFAALDIGSHKCVCVIAELGRNLAETRILGVGHVLSKGIRHGLITDSEEAETSIITAIHTAEKMAEITVDEIWISLSLQGLRARQLTVDLSLSNQLISDRELQDIMAESAAPIPDDEVLLHGLPMSYTLDQQRGIRDPRGMIGELLSTHMLLLSAPANLVRNLTHCLHRYQLDVAGIVAAPYAAALACLEKDEQELGTLLIDIGATSTGFALFSAGRIVDAGMVSVGGNHITQDIAHGLNTSMQDAERLKNMHGGVLISPVDDTVMLEVPHLGQSGTEESSLEKRSLLNHIIRPRAEEILELTRNAIDSNLLRQFSTGRVVLTGGSSQLLGLNELTQKVFDRRVRVGVPQLPDSANLPDAVSGPAFSNVMGMLQHIRLCHSETGWLHRPYSRPTGFAGLRHWFNWFRQNVA